MTQKSEKPNKPRPLAPIAKNSSWGNLGLFGLGESLFTNHYHGRVDFLFFSPPWLSRLFFPCVWGAHPAARKCGSGICQVATSKIWFFGTGICWELVSIWFVYFGIVGNQPLLTLFPWQVGDERLCPFGQAQGPGVVSERFSPQIEQVWTLFCFQLE